MSTSSANSTSLLPQATKPNHAVEVRDGKTYRTIWGFLLPADLDVIAREYPEVPRSVVEQIALERNEGHVEMIPAPRLLEVLTVVELTARFLREEWSRIKRGIPEGLKLVASPLSILSFMDGVVRRVITPETEMMHKPAEKLALRSGAMDRINLLLNERFGMQLAFGCSCCALAFRTEDRARVLGSKYYARREQMGRWYDSDVLAAAGRLHGPVPVGEVPAEFLDGSVDFGTEEVASYQRFARVAQACIDEHPDGNTVNVNAWFNRAACFVGGQCPKEDGSCPVPPSWI